MDMSKLDLIQQFMDNLLECYRMEMLTDEHMKKLSYIQEKRSNHIFKKIRKRCPELEDELEDYIAIITERDCLEQEWLYQQGGKDMVKLLKKVGAL